MCECVIMEVAEYFPVEETGSESDESDEECDSSGIIDLREQTGTEKVRGS